MGADSSSSLHDTFQSVSQKLKEHTDMSVSILLQTERESIGDCGTSQEVILQSRA